MLYKSLFEKFLVDGPELEYFIPDHITSEDAEVMAAIMLTTVANWIQNNE